MERIELRVEDATFFALATGPKDGRVAVLLHGFPDGPATWAPVMARLAARGWRCVAPWMRGYAPSASAGPFGLDRLSRDALAFAAELSPKAPVVLFGHDWGAAATWFAAARAPARIAAAIALSVPHPIAFARSLVRDPRQLARSRYMFALQARSIDRAGIERLWRRWSPGLTPDAAHLDAVAASIADGGDAAVHYYRALLRPTRLEWMRMIDRDRATVRAPLLYLHGLDDGCIAPGCARGQERLVEAPYRMEILPGAGHFLPLERPDVVADRALRFVDAYAPRPAARSNGAQAS
ncbi:MAG: alpha/beta fold hydrolase [Sandaracinaceae bacterium]|nr:alpha/beta fold hydrolase [Sandaracinaceae bacterium]